jgi:hypothetical protein
MSNPSEPLGLTVHSLPQPGLESTPQRRSGRVQMLLVLLVCVLPVLASYYTYFVIRPSGSTAYSILIQPARPMPDVVASSLDGQPQPLRALTGQWLLVVVGGGACADDCERQLFLQRQLREMTGRESERIEKLWLLIDDMPVSAELRAAVEATPAMNILRLPRDVVAAWLKPASGQKLEDHLYIVDPLGDWMMRAPAQADPIKLKSDLARLLRASAGWDQAGRQTLITSPAAASPAASSPAAMPAAGLAKP